VPSGVAPPRLLQSLPTPQGEATAAATDALDRRHPGGAPGQTLKEGYAPNEGFSATPEGEHAALAPRTVSLNSFRVGTQCPPSTHRERLLGEEALRPSVGPLKGTGSCGRDRSLPRCVQAHTPPQHEVA
jgi:hypothetical protein